MKTGISVSISMGCLWQGAFTTVKIMVIAKMTVSLSSKAALPIVLVRLETFSMTYTASASLTGLLLKIRNFR